MLPLRSSALSVLLRCLLLSCFVVAVSACSKKSEGPEHQRVGSLEVAVLEVEKTKRVSRPGITYEPPTGKEYIRVALHAHSTAADDELKDEDVQLVGAAGTKVAAEKGWGRSRLSNAFFTIVEYYFTFPTTEAVASLQVKGTALPLAKVRNAWPFKVSVERVTLADSLTVNYADVGDRVVSANPGEKFVVLDVSIETTLPRPAALPPADSQSGDLRIYTEKLAPDVSVRIGALRGLGEGEDELFFAAFAPAGQDHFLGIARKTEVAVASDKPKLALRLAGRNTQDVAAKLKSLRFGSIVSKLPAVKP